MYRQYEDPRELENRLEKWLENHPKENWDEFDYETYSDLKERINFAWQDEEYDEIFYDYYGGGEIEDCEGW
jgi:hypothetical protein